MSEPVGERPAMSDYGVDTPDWTPLPWSWAATRLGQGRNYWVVTASASARPHALPVWGVWDHDDLRFAFSCSPRSRKAANVAANPQITVAIDDTVECVSVEGRATAVEGDRKDLWVERYLAQVRTDRAGPHRRRSSATTSSSSSCPSGRSGSSSARRSSPPAPPAGGSGSGTDPRSRSRWPRNRRMNAADRESVVVVDVGVVVGQHVAAEVATCPRSRHTVWTWLTPRWVLSYSASSVPPWTR